MTRAHARARTHTQGAAYHQDLLALGLITGCSSIAGLPWMCSATVQVPWNGMECNALFFLVV